VKPHLHANISAKQHGGEAEDYMAIHEFIDHSKAAMPDVRHRAMLHSAWGIYVCQQVFGHLITNSDGKKIAVRDIAEEHVIQDLGFIPTMEDWLRTMPIEPWMSGTRKTTRVMEFNAPRAAVHID
jgi:hypothetical protein